jgi:hypothetical protein
MTGPEALALCVLAGIMAGTVWLVRHPRWGLRALGWMLALIVVLFGGLIVLTQGSALGPGDYFGGPQDKFPNGGLEVGYSPARGTDV